MITQRPTIGSFRSSGMAGILLVQTCHMIRSKSGDGDDQLEDPLARRPVEARIALEQLDVEPDRVARLRGPSRANGTASSRMAPVATSTVVPLADGRPAWFRTGDGTRRGRLHHHDLPLRRVDEADAEAIGLGQPLARRAPFGVDADQEPLGVEPEPDRSGASPCATSVIVPRSLPQT